MYQNSRQLGVAPVVVTTAKAIAVSAVKKIFSGFSASSGFLERQSVRDAYWKTAGALMASVKAGAFPPNTSEKIWNDWGSFLGNGTLTYTDPKTGAVRVGIGVGRTGTAADLEYLKSRLAYYESESLKELGTQSTPATTGPAGQTTQAGFASALTSPIVIGALVIAGIFILRRF